MNCFTVWKWHASSSMRSFVLGVESISSRGTRFNFIIAITSVIHYGVTQPSSSFRSHCLMLILRPRVLKGFPQYPSCTLSRPSKPAPKKESCPTSRSWLFFAHTRLMRGHGVSHICYSLCLKEISAPALWGRVFLGIPTHPPMTNSLCQVRSRAQAGFLPSHPVSPGRWTVRSMEQDFCHCTSSRWFVSSVYAVWRGIDFVILLPVAFDIFPGARQNQVAGRFCYIFPKDTQLWSCVQRILRTGTWVGSCLLCGGS